MNPIIILAFKCVNKRRKGIAISTCDGLMAGQLINLKSKAAFLLHCEKCSSFYIATPTDGIYRLTKINKNNIKFVTQPVMAG